MLEIIYLGASGLNKLLGLVTTGDKLLVSEKVGSRLIEEGAAELVKSKSKSKSKSSKDE